MAGVHSAYAANADNGSATIYVNADDLEAASDSEVRMWLLEEIGHHFDSLLNGGVDSPGDEGALFANLFNGNELSLQERAAISAENDSVVLTVDGRQVVAEAAAANVLITGFTDNVESYTGAFSSSNTLTNDGTPTINLTYNSNTTDANRYIVLWANNGTSTLRIGSLLTPLSVSSGVSASLTPSSALASGTYAFWATVSSISNPTAPSVPGSGTFSIRIDTAAPVGPTIALASDTGSSNSDRVTSNGLINVSGIEAGASWEYSTNSGVSWTAGSGTTFTLAAGTYASSAVRVRQFDAAGNSATRTALAITVDASPPSAPTFALFSDSGSSNSDGITNDGRVTVTGIETGAKWEYSVNSGGSWTTGSGTSFTLLPGTYAAGVIRVRQTDLAGNTSTTSSQNAGAITVDIVAPTPTFALVSDTGSSSSDGITNNPSVNVSGIEAGASWEYSTNTGSSWTAGRGASFTLDPGSYAAGEIRLRQTDLAGNSTRVPAEIIPAYTTTDSLGTPTSSGGNTAVGNVASSFGFFFDTSSDVLIDALGFSSQPGWPQGSSSYTVSLWSYNNGGGSPADYGSAPLASAVFTPGNVYAYKDNYFWNSITPITLPDTFYTDVDGLRGYVIAVVGNFSASAGNIKYESGTPNFDSRFVIAGNGYNYATDTAGFYPVPIFDGDIATSGYFNPNLSYRPAAVTIDVTAPAAPAFALASDTGSSASDGITTNGLVSVSGIETGASWEYSTNSGGSWTTGSGTSFTLAAGSYAAGVIRVRQTDTAGNTTATPSQNAGAITIDLTSPAAAVAISLIDTDTGINGDFVTSDTTLTVKGTNGTLGASETVQISANGTTWSNVSQGTGIWSFTDSTVRPSNVTYQVRVIDLAGNVGNTASRLATIDTQAPTTLAAVTNVKTPGGLSIGNNQSTSSTSQLTVEGSLTTSLVAGESVLIYDGVTQLGTATVSGSGWTFTDNRTLNANQVVQYSSRVADLAANQSPAGPSYTINVSIQTTPVISVSNLRFVEGNTGTSAASFLVSLSTSSNQTVSVNYSFRQGTGSGFANSADFSVSSSSGTLVFSPGTLSRTIPFTVNGDTTVEPDELFYLDLTNPSTNSTLSGNVATLTATATILNDDTNPNQGITIISGGNFSGSPLDDVLTGDNLVNQIQGLAGNDTITGLGGADVLSGGTGADLFRYTSFSDSTLAAIDQLADFSSTQGDRIGVQSLPTAFWNVGNLGAITTISLANAMQSAFNDKNRIVAGNQPLSTGEAVTFSWSDGQRRYNYVAVADGNSGNLNGDLLLRLPSTSFPTLSVGDISSFSLFTAA
jgi:hypothetical protein